MGAQRRGKKLVLLAMVAGTTAFTSWSGIAHATSFGSEITISDGVFQGTGWYSGREDQEVEPGCVASQAWDLEAIFLDGKTLSVVGGFDFARGNEGFLSGDLFLDVTGDAKYGPTNGSSPAGYATVPNAFGYDYVLDLDFAVNRYSVYRLDGASTVSVFFGQNSESNPWRYASGGALLDGWSGRALSFYATGLSDGDTGLKGGTHNAFGVDLSFLAPGTEFVAHFTVGCGNDNLMGHGEIAPVPEPATLLLLGSGLLGVAAKVRRARND